jgi:hypothetical protein
MKTKSLLSFIVLVVIILSQSLFSTLKAQSPDMMSFQSVIRNSSGLLVTNQSVGVKLSVLQGTASGTVIYSENHTVTSNNNGLISLEIGAGSVLTGSFSAIDWTSGPYFLETEVDPTGGSAYTISSVNQFLSVPYAKYADKAGSTSGAAGGDLGGTYPNPSVVRIQSLPISTVLPTSYEGLIWNGTEWSPGPTVTGLASGDLGASYPNPTVVKLQSQPVSATVPAVNEALVWNGTAWAPGANVTGAAGGDLGGTYPNPSVVKLQSSPVSATAPLVSDALVWNGTAWAPTASSGIGTNYWTLNGTGDIFNNNASGNVGVGTNAATYKFDLLHNGSTGARIRSDNSFSVVDIDALNGDAALRFAKAGVNQWNVRNRPADNYLEIFELGGGGSRMVIQDATGYVGIGGGATVAPAYQLDVENTGSTGIRSKSSSSFSVVDIDAASGDAALRFAKAGVNQWNIRNRPADDYLEIFELGGGGSRFVIQDATGNVGIGETTSPAYKLDVLHGGSTGLRVRSSSSFSVIDIDGQSGDAALRFVKAGVNQWNIRNRPADDYLEIFELGGGGSRFVIQDATGNVGIGETTSPAYKLDILHGGSTGVRVRSSSSFSVVDIDGQSGDAALRFVKAGVNQWNIRNNPATDDLQIFELGGGGERMRIDNTTGKVWVNGDFTVVGVKAFTMDHPLDPENKMLMHAAAESNEVINFYSGNITTDADGKAVVSLPDYFEAINKDFRYQLTVIGAFAQAIISREVENNTFEIATSLPNVKVSWEVKGVRNDAHMRNTPFVAEQEKSASQKGKYIDPAAYNLSQNRSMSYDAGSTGTSSLDYVAPVDKAANPANLGGSLDQIVLPKAKTLPVETESSILDIVPVSAKKAAPANTGGSLDQMKVAPVKATEVDSKGSVSDIKPAANATVNTVTKPSAEGSSDK